MILKAVKWLGRILSGLVVLSIVVTLVFRFVPLPFSSLMIIRALEMQGNGKPMKMDYRWVSLPEISPQLRKAVIAAEDQRFYEHWGFDLDAIEKAVEHNKVAKVKRGASTISQQTAKNLFLWPGRSWLRKGLEAYFTVLLEMLWPKDRILEVYLNIAEWGDGLYGAEQAARVYFDKTADKLTLGESARLAACLPSPRKWNPKRPNPYVLARAGGIIFAVKQMEVNRLLDEVSAEIGGEGDESGGESDEASSAAKRRRLPSSEDSAPAGESPSATAADSLVEEE